MTVVAGAAMTGHKVIWVVRRVLRSSSTIIDYCRYCPLLLPFVGKHTGTKGGIRLRP